MQPAFHHINCDYHLDNYPHECSCGALTSFAEVVTTPDTHTSDEPVCNPDEAGDAVAL